MFFKVAPRVEKTEASKKVDILQIGVFASCIMKKHFLLCTKETVFFPYFYHEITFYSAELFDSVVHFKFYLNISMFLNKHKSNIKEAISELRSSHLFRDQLYKEVLEVKCQICNFAGVLSFLRILVTFVRHVLCRTSHNLVCNKFAI